MFQFILNFFDINLLQFSFQLEKLFSLLIKSFLLLISSFPTILNTLTFLFLLLFFGIYYLYHCSCLSWFDKGSLLLNYWLTWWYTLLLLLILVVCDFQVRSLNLSRLLFTFLFPILEYFFCLFHTQFRFRDLGCLKWVRRTLRGNTLWSIFRILR